MSRLKPLKDGIIFEFLDTARGGGFASKTKSGIILTNTNPEDNAGKPRWGIALETGPEVEHVKVGDYILITPLRWTYGFKFGDKTVSKTIEKEVMAIADDVADVNDLYI